MNLKKTYDANYCRQKGLGKKFYFMPLTVIFLFITSFQISAKGFTQPVTLFEKKTSLEKVLKKIKKQTNYSFFYDAALLKKSNPVTIDIKNVSLEQALKDVFIMQPITFEIVSNKIITLKEKDLKEITKAIKTPIEVPYLEVKGKIVDENGVPIIGATVMVKETKLITTTNTIGEFSFNNINENATLIISAVNIETIEIKVNKRSNLETIIVKTKIKELESVVVNTGYQTISKERSTAAHGSVTSEILLKRPTSNLADALVGQIAGLVADPLTGFTIRGRSSLSGVSDRIPLLIVDGFPVEGGFSTLNPNDIKSVDVLKDAAATSLYGARAANGVIVVVTKGTGAKGKMNVSYNSFLSIGEHIDLDNYMNIADASTQINFEEKLYNTFKGVNTSIYSDPYTANVNGNFRGIRSPYTQLLIELDKGRITQEYFNSKKNEMLNTSYKDDYKKYLLRNQIKQQHNLIISGTGEKNSYKFSILYDNDKTSYQYNDNNKIILNLTNIFNISKNIKYTFSSNLTNTINKNNGININHAKSVTAPWTRLVNDDGNYTRMNYQNYEPRVSTFETRLPYSMQYNLLEETNLRNNTYNGLDIRLQNEFEFKILKNLKIRPMFQYELFNDQNLSIYNEKSYAVRNYANWVSRLDTPSNTYVSYIPKGGIYRNNGENKRQSLKLRLQMDYNKTFKNKHEIIALAGTEVISNTSKVNGPDINFGYSQSGLNYALFDYATDRVDLFNIGTILENSVSYEGDNIYNFRQSSFRQSYKYNERFFAGYLNGAYTYDKRYTATFSMRTDASNYVSKTIREKFSPFYSAGLRWNIDKEAFFKNVTFVDKLSLRATYGVTGNAAGKTSVLALSVFTSGAPSTETGNLSTGFITGRDNDFLTWEKTYSTNIGTDFSMFKGKLFGSLDFYRRKSKDLLSSVLTSQVIQSTSSLSLNLAQVLNKGFELSLGTNLNITKNLNWSSIVNFDLNKNEVLKFNFLAPSLFNYLGTNGTFIAGLPTDRLMMVKLVGTTNSGYYVQQKKDGELIIANTSGNSFADVGSFGLARTIPGISPKDDTRVYYQGRTTPPATLGFTNTFGYKGFSFMSVITGRFGHKFIRSDEIIAYNLNNNNYSASGLANLQPNSLTATTVTGNVNPTLINQAMVGNSTSLRNFYSDAVVEDASHIRLNELYLGYDITNQVLNKLKNFFKSATIYTQARNLGIVWKATAQNVDPEFRLGTIRPIKTITIGIRLGM